jgi:hypothetical protein
MSEFSGDRDGERPASFWTTYGPPIWRIALLLVLLVMLVALRRPCAEGVAGFVGNFGPPPSATPTDAGARR